jgi:hypothetical protein
MIINITDLNKRTYRPNKGIPVIPPLPEETYSEYRAKCGECGVLIPKGAWSYSCSNGRCPVFRKATY